MFKCFSNQLKISDDVIDLRVFSKDQLRKIARVAERETDLLIDATRKLLPSYGLTDDVSERAIDLLEESRREAESRGLTEIRSYQFRKEYIKKAPF